jgi:hypothetical protein
MKGLIIFLIMFGVFNCYGQQPKPKKRDYKGCVTTMDSIVRKSAWNTIDSLKQKGYIKN